MKNNILIILTCVSILPLISAPTEPTLKGVYHVAPDNKTIVYRHAFVQTAIEKETTSKRHLDIHKDITDSFPITDEASKIKEVKVSRYFPAGFYYKNSDIAYDVPVGGKTLYSLQKTPSGRLQSLIVWDVHNKKFTAQDIVQDALQRYDSKVKHTLVGGVCGGIIGSLVGIIGNRWLNVTDDAQLAINALTGVVGIWLGSKVANSRKTTRGLMDLDYMSNISSDILQTKMSATSDSRQSLVTGKDLSVRRYLPVDAEEAPGQPHISHFAITPATAENIQRAEEGMHAANGSIAYELSNEKGYARVAPILKELIQSKMTIFAALKRLFGRGDVYTLY